MAGVTHKSTRVASKIISPIVTPGLTQTDSTARVPLGTIAFTDAGGIAEYIYALSTLSQYAFCMVLDGGTAQMLTTTLANDAGTGKKVACPQASIASAYFGWGMRMGTFIGRFSDDAADQVPLFTTATEGELDDATVSNCLVAGIYLNTTESLATALTCYAAVPMYVAPYTNPA
jgi:hypothetical protein